MAEEMHTTSAAGDYNQAAVEIAAEVHAARSQAVRDRERSPLPRARLFPPQNRPGLGVALEYERMGNQPVSDALQEQANSLGVTFEHLGLTLGTVIHGLTLKQKPNAQVVQFIRATLLERKVIFFRDQFLSEDEQVTFSRCFGELDAFPFGKPGENPFILEIVHGDQSPGTENGWHTDVTWMQEPSLGSVAQCVVAPPVGGDTLFADSHAAYLALPDDLRERIRALRGINDYRLFLGRNLPDSLVQEIKAKIPFGVDHPLARTHPETGKTALYIHGGFLRHDSLFEAATGEPLPEEESRAIVAELLKQHQRPEFSCRFGWHEGSIAFWDNRAVQHYAASDYFPHRRVLRRVTVSGDRPFYDPEREG